MDKRAAAELDVCFRAILKNGTVLQRSLLLRRVKTDDLKSTFTCVVTNAAGSTRKVTTLSQAVKSRKRH